MVPALDRAEVVVALESKRLAPKEEVVDWFSTIGGIGPTSAGRLMDHQIGPTFAPVTLESALEIRDRVLLLLHSNPDDPDMYVPGIESFLPIGRAGMHMHCVDLAAGNPQHSPVRLFDPPDIDPTYRIDAWPSLLAMVEEWLELWESGAITYDSRNGIQLHEDDDDDD